MQTKILIVEDEAITAMDIKRTLKILGFEVVSTASRGKEAIQKAKELKPDLILMDIIIKGEMDGIETAEIIKEQFNIPVIYLTAHSDKSTYERAKLTEPYGFITKPINPEGLNGSIETAIYKHKLDQKLAESEIKFRSLFSSITEGVAIYESIHDSGNKIVDFIVSDVNPAYESILGIKRSEVIGQKVTILHGSNKLPYMETFIKVAESGQPENFESYLESIDKYFDITVTSIEKRKFATFFQDITESKRAEEQKQEALEEVQQFAEELEVSNEELQSTTEELQVANEELRQQGDELIELNHDLRESEEKFRSFYELPLIGIAITSPEKGWIEANDKICDILGYSHEELYNISWDEITYPDDLNKDLEQFNRVLNGHIDGYNIEKRFIRKDGSVVFTYISVGCIRNEDNSVNYFVVLIDDISEIKKAEEGFNESEHKYRTLFDNAGDGILIMKKDRFIDCNSRAMEIYGATKEEIIGKTPYDVFSPEYQDQELSKEKALKYIDRALKGEQQLFDWEHKSLDGVILNTEVSLNRLKLGSEYYLMAIVRDVTERVEAAKSIKESEIYYKTIFENTGTATIIIEEDKTISLVNSEFEKLYGYNKEEVEGKIKWTDFVADKDDLDLLKKYHELRSNNSASAPKNYEFKFRNRNKEVKDVFATVELIPETKKRLISLLDITDKKKSRKALRENKAKLRIAMDMAKLVYWEYDVKTDMFTFDDQFYSLYGTNIDEAGGIQMSSGEYATMFIPPEESSMVAEEIAKALEADDPNYFQTIEHSIIRADGEKRFMLVRLGVIKDDKGNTIKTYGANQDITERKKAEIKNQELLEQVQQVAEELQETTEELQVTNEELRQQSDDLIRINQALQESETKFRELFNNALDIIVLSEIQENMLPGNFIEVNKAAIQKLGYTKEEFLNITPLDLFAPDNINEIPKIGAELQKRRYTIFESSSMAKDGRNFPTEVSLHVFKLGGKEVLLAIGRDITERKKAENALKESETKFREIFDNATDMITLHEIEENGLPGNFIEINEVGIKRLGYTKEEFLNMGPSDIVVPDKRSEMPEIAAKLKKEGEITFEIVHVTKNGNRIPIEVNSHLFELNGRTVTIGISRDITDRKKAEEKIKASLKEKELLLKEIHHRVKNNIQIISSLLNLQSDYIEDENAINVFKESQERIRSISLVHESLYLSDNLSSIDFEDYIIKMVMGLISNYNAKMIDVNYNIEHIQLNIETAIPCGLIINELITNAIKHAFPHNEGLINVQFTHESDKLKLVISDNGIGIPDQLIMGDSNKLGLRLVKTLADQLDAELNRDNNDGTTFTIIFKELQYKERFNKSH